MKSLRAVALLLFALMTGCVSGRVVRLETGRGAPVVFTPPSEAEPVELKKGEFKEAVSTLARDMRPPAHPQRAAQELFGVDARSGAYLFNPRTRQVTPLDGVVLASDTPPAEVELTRAYLSWCARTERTGDCLHLLVESPTVVSDGRYALAMAFAQGVVWNEMLDAFKDMADPQAVLSAALWTVTMYLILWTAPEPVSKGLAAIMTVTAIAYLGVDTFWTLIEGFKRLVDVADRATTFDELREAGERYGKVLGKNAARAFALLATVAVGNTAAGFASKVPMLPGAAQAAAQAEAQAGLRLAAVSDVQSVAITAEAVTIALAPGAVAMVGRGRQTSSNPSESIKSLKTRLAEHRQKLADYKARPDAFDNQDLLRNAPSPAIRQRIINGRIKHLEDEIQAFEKAIRDLGGEP